MIHIGAHFGEEYLKYYKPDGIQNCLFFEPLPECFNVLEQNVGNGGILVNKALGSKPAMMEMYVETANSGQSSSLLKPKLHLERYPHIQFPYRVTVEVSTLDREIDQEIEFRDKYNFINIDVQGYELEVFKGAKRTLEHVEYINSEVNRAELYEDYVQVEELDEFLEEFGFDRVETRWEGNWGDAFYLKH